MCAVRISTRFSEEDLCIKCILGYAITHIIAIVFKYHKIKCIHVLSIHSFKSCMIQCSVNEVTRGSIPTASLKKYNPNRDKCKYQKRCHD